MTVHGVPVLLHRRGFDLLEILMQNLGRVVPYAELAQSAWGYAAAGDQRFIYTAAWRLRRALADVDADKLFVSLRGVGYSIRDHAPTKAPPMRGYAIVDPDQPRLPLLMVSESIEQLRRADREPDDSDRRTVAQLRDWSPEDYGRIRRGINEAVSVGQAAVRGVRWPHDGVPSVLDMDLVRLQGDSNVLVLCDISEVVEGSASVTH